MAMMGRHTGGMLLPARSRPTLLRVRAQSQNGLPSRTAVGATATYLQVESLNGGPALQTEQRPITVNVTTPEVQPQLYTPVENYANLAKLGAKKSEMSPAKLFVSGILAGCYIAFGGFLMCAVAGNMQSLPVGVVKLISGLIFPVGLLMVTMSGSELYTGNTAVIPMAMYEGKASLGGMLTNWFWSYAGNYVGSLAMVAAVAATGVLAGNVVPVNVATMKASLPLATVLVRSTLCNWLVCMAVWHAASATTLPGKMMGLWAPIATFVAIGLEHSVANMFFIPMGMVLGAKVTFSEFMLNNLLPVTLGNTLGGFLFVGTAFSFLYGRLGQPKSTAAVAAS